MLISICRCFFADRDWSFFFFFFFVNERHTETTKESEETGYAGPVWENPSRGSGSWNPPNKTKSSSSPEAHGIEIGIGISYGEVEEGLILYLNTRLSEDYMHFNYRPDAVALTLPRRRPAIVKFLNYRYLDARVERPVNSKDIRQLPLFLSLSLSLFSFHRSMEEVPLPRT